MFIAILLTGNPLIASLVMEMVDVFRCVEALEFYFIYIAIFPAFVGSYVKACDLALILSVCEGLKHLGEFMAIARWPVQLLCGDPMNCWRSQYLYSHAIFYNSNGDGGNINYV